MAVPANDELRVYRGSDFMVNDTIRIHQPTLGEICDYGEQNYYQMVITLTCVPADMKWQLFDMGIDYTEVEEFQFFYSFLCKSFDRKQTEILFGDLDFASYEPYVRPKTGEVVLYHPKRGDIIDEKTYQTIMEYVREIHGLVKDEKRPANESTKQILIEDAREEYQRHKDKPYHSQLKNLISAMINSEGFKENYHTVWDMKIHAFMDSVKRVSKIKNATLLLQSGYSGFGISLKDVGKQEIDWLGAL